jgi:transposase
LCAAGIVCAVAAPSKLQRPSGDRVKTDARDARHLARLGEIVEVTVPSIEQEGRARAGWPIRIGDALGHLHRRVRVLDDNKLDELALAGRCQAHTAPDLKRRLGERI